MSRSLKANTPQIRIILILRELFIVLIHVKYFLTDQRLLLYGVEQISIHEFKDLFFWLTKIKVGLIVACIYRNEEVIEVFIEPVAIEFNILQVLKA